MATQREQGERIRNAREARRWSQEDLAAAAHVSPNTVISVEAGNSARPSSLSKIEAALELEPFIEHVWNAGLPADVQLILETLGYFLADLPKADRPKAAAKILRAMTDWKNAPTVQ